MKKSKEDRVSKEDNKKQGQLPMTLRSTMIIPIVQVSIITLALIRVWLFLIFSDRAVNRLFVLDVNYQLWIVIWTLIIIPAVMIFGVVRMWYWNNNKYVIEDGEVEHHRGVFWKKRVILKFPSVDKISIRQGFWAKIFGYGSIDLLSSETQEKITIKNINRPRVIARIIKEEFPGPERM